MKITSICILLLSIADGIFGSLLKCLEKESITASWKSLTLRKKGFDEFFFSIVQCLGGQEISRQVAYEVYLKKCAAFDGILVHPAEKDLEHVFVNFVGVNTDYHSISVKNMNILREISFALKRQVNIYIASKVIEFESILHLICYSKISSVHFQVDSCMEQVMMLESKAQLFSDCTLRISVEREYENISVTLAKKKIKSNL